MNKILRLVCRQADFKKIVSIKIVSIGFFGAFLAVFLSVGTAQASFWDWFNLNKASNDSQQAAAIADTEVTNTTPTIKVVSPNGGEVWKAGTKKNIVFKGNLIKEKVNISLEWSSGGLSIGESITSGNAKAFTYSWTIPKTLEERNDYRIRVEYKTAQDGGDLSDKTFTIKSASGSSSSKSSSSRSSRSSSSKSSSSSATSNVTLNVQKQGKGAIKSDDGKINCGTDCKEVYPFGGQVVLTATPTKGFSFDKWTGNACFDSGYEYKDVTIGHCTVSLEGKSKALTAKAHFKKTFGPWE